MSRLLGGMLVGGLLAGLAAREAMPAHGAELLKIRLDDLDIPVPIRPLDAWSRRDPASRPDEDDLSPWLELIDPGSRYSLQRMLRAPLLRDRSFGRQLLDSWAGGQLLGELGTILTTREGRSTTALLQTTLRRLLEERREVSLLEVIKALPTPELNLELDSLLVLGERWRLQLRQQRQALVMLRRQPLAEPPGATPSPVPREPDQPLRQVLAVPGRSEGLPLEIWPAQRQSPAAPWVLLMPGLGGNADQFGWLASGLARRGWPVVVLQHPDSDARALREALSGQRPPPGAETLPARLADAQAVINAQRQGRLPLRGKGVVMAGHSLGGLTALLSTGLRPVGGLADRCRSALQRLPIQNPSRLIQCQLPDRALGSPRRPPSDLRGLLIFNGFGSLFWPDGSLAGLPVPLLMVGGSLDLITPPIEEQLALFLPVRDPRSRLVLVVGGSHFSPVRMADRDERLLQIGQELVGVDPLRVQRLLLSLSGDFLTLLEGPASPPRGATQPLLPAQRRLQEGVTAYVLDPAAARRWWAALQ